MSPKSCASLGTQEGNTFLAGIQRQTESKPLLSETGQWMALWENQSLNTFPDQWGPAQHWALESSWNLQPTAQKLAHAFSTIDRNSTLFPIWLQIMKLAPKLP